MSVADYMPFLDWERRKKLKSQWLEVIEHHTVTCECGQKRALELAYRCLYCGMWYCFNCAEIHFNLTLKEWRNDIIKKRQAILETTAKKILSEQYQSKVTEIN